jgi:toxin ParE1/3/4
MLILSREAEQDVRSAFEWYEDQRENLGRAFMAEVDRALEAVQERPEAYLQCYKFVRRALCKRFPYAIYFVLKNSDVVVLAVLHQRRHPASWRKRIQ